MLPKDVFARFVFTLAKVFPKYAPDFKDEYVFEFWFDAFKNHSIEELKLAVEILKYSCEEFPSIKKIKSILTTGLDNEQEIGEDVAARIEAAIVKFGYTNSKEAEKYVGPLAWEVVNQLGGWERLCETKIDELPSARRQWREFAKVLNKKSINGNLRQGPALQPPSNVRNLIKVLTNGVRTLSLVSNDSDVEK